MRTIPVGSRDRQNLWMLVLLLLPGVWGDDVWKVNYPDPICAIKGSTVTIPCSYKYPETHRPVRVIWCINHEICQTTTPKIYDSNSTTNRPVFKYIGDKKNNCTLQIENINTTDSKTYRFRFETDPINGFTGQSGVRIEVREIDNNIKLNVTASDDRASKERVTLSCTSSSPCIFNNLKITWYHNNNILQATGPTLTLSDSGKYSCGLESSPLSRSDAYSFQVEDPPKLSIVHIVVPVLLILLTITVAAAILLIRRRKAEDPKKEKKDGVSTLPGDVIYSSKTTPQTTGNNPQEEEAVNYATVNIQHKTSSRPANIKQEEDPVIYSAVSRRKAEDPKKEKKDGVSTLPGDVIYSSKTTPQTTGNNPQEEEEVNYATVNIQHKTSSRPANIKQEEDPVIYSAVSRRKAEDPKKEKKDGVSTLPGDVIYSSKTTPQTTGNNPQEEEEVNYATVNIQHKTSSRPANIKQEEDPVIYSAVSRCQ